VLTCPVNGFSHTLDNGCPTTVPNAQESPGNRWIAVRLVGPGSSRVRENPFYALISKGGGVEFGIGGYQHQRWVCGVDFQNRRELHGVVATQAVPSRQRGGLGDQAGRYLDEARTNIALDLVRKSG
jgi:hypothetical protein